MSAALKVLLLLILLFLVFWAYQFREKEVQVLLGAFREPPRPESRPAPGGISGDGSAGINGPFAGTSPVDRVVDPRDTQLRGVWGVPDPPEPREWELEPEPELAAGPAVEPAEPEEVLLPAGPARPAGEPAKLVAVEEAPAPSPGENQGPVAPGPAPAPPEVPGSGEVEFTYQVQERDTLWKIARRFLGSGLRHRDIQSWNPGKVAADGTVAVGVQLVIRGVRPAAPVPPPPRPDPSPPPPEKARPGAGEKSSGNGKPAGDQTVRPEKKKETRDPAPRPITHRVMGKETLAALARRYYRGDGELWTRIYEANRDVLEDPHALQVGIVLKIPDLAAGPGRGSFR